MGQRRRPARGPAPPPRPPQHQGGDPRQGRRGLLAASRRAGTRQGGPRGAALFRALAEECLLAKPAGLVAIGGLSGTGKTTIARELAPLLGRLPGSVHLRSDIERKRLFATAETEHLPQAGYAPDATARVYELVGRKAKRIASPPVTAWWPDAVHAFADGAGRDRGGGGALRGARFGRAVRLETALPRCGSSASRRGAMTHPTQRPIMCAARPASMSARSPGGAWRPREA